MVALETMNKNEQMNTSRLQRLLHSLLIVYQILCCNFCWWFYFLQELLIIRHHEAFFEEYRLNLHFLPSFHAFDIKQVNIFAKSEFLSLVFWHSYRSSTISMLFLYIFILYLPIIKRHHREIISRNYLSYDWLFYLAVYKSLVLKVKMFRDFARLLLENLGHLVLENHGVAGHCVQIYKQQLSDWIWIVYRQSWKIKLRILSTHWACLI